MRCDVHADTPDGARCPNTATRTVAAGCVHEHLEIYADCGQHPRPMFCNMCGRTSSLPHECPLTMIGVR